MCVITTVTVAVAVVVLVVALLHVCLYVASLHVAPCVHTPLMLCGPRYCTARACGLYLERLCGRQLILPPTPPAANCAAWPTVCELPRLQRGLFGAPTPPLQPRLQGPYLVPPPPTLGTPMRAANDPPCTSTIGMTAVQQHLAICRWCLCNFICFLEPSFQPCCLFISPRCIYPAPSPASPASPRRLPFEAQVPQPAGKEDTPFGSLHLAHGIM